MKYAAVKGMNDLLPPESGRWQCVEEKARQIFCSYGFQEVRTPVVEPTELFVRTIGETSAIVEKEMYTFEDRNGKSLSLRPEGTASIVRAYNEANLSQKEPIVKWVYFGPMFRYERPQKGRYRQFYQIGAELIGVRDPLADAEVLIMLHHFFHSLGIEDTELEINSIGCQKCRPVYLKVIQEFLKEVKDKLCKDCLRRSQKNPLRILDCKNNACHKWTQRAPLVEDYWCPACREHYADVRGLLVAGRVPFKENRRIVRGLDYYCKTAFEFVCRRLGSQNAVAAGGRYDGLVQDLGGGNMPGVGFAVGMERLVMLVPEAKEGHYQQNLVFFALLGKEAEQKALAAMYELRAKGIRVESGYGGSLKSQMRRAGKLKASKAVILGDEEIQKGVAQIKDMESGAQQEVLLGRLVENL